MLLSFRGSERQPPNLLQMSLRFSIAMESRAKEGLHSPELTPEARLRKVIAEFHDTPGMVAKWQLDEDRVQSCLNLICGTSPEARQTMTSHLHHFKWAQSAFNAELLRRPRWLLSALPRVCPDVFKKILVVTPKSQALFLKLVTHTFTEKTRKVRANQRARMRLSNAEWDAYVNYSCVFAVVMSEAALLDKPPCANTLMKSFLDMWLGFRTFNHDWSLELSVIGLVGTQILRFCCSTPGCLRDYFQEIDASISVEAAGWKVQKLTLWCDLVQKPDANVVMADRATTETAEDQEAALEEASFAAIRAKIATLVQILYQNANMFYESYRILGTDT